MAQYKLNPFTKKMERWPDAVDIPLDTTNFDQILSTEDNVQDALDVLDDHTHPATVHRITDADSPYTLVSTDFRLMCDTDAAEIQVILSAGIDAREVRLYNVGSSNNQLTITPDGSEKIFGDSSLTIYDGEVIDITYETTEGWR